MLLSYGALKFKDQHLEYNVDPKDLHRDFFFRRLNYGNQTHLNVSVVVGEDNKASLFISLDRGDRPYYACDAGCLDPPVKLRYQIILVTNNYNFSELLNPRLWYTRVYIQKVVVLLVVGSCT